MKNIINRNMKIKIFSFILVMFILLQSSSSSNFTGGICYSDDYQEIGTPDEIRISNSDLNDRFIPEDTGVYPSTPPDTTLSEKLSKELSDLEGASKNTSDSLSPDIKKVFDKKMQEYFPSGLENASEVELDAGREKFISDISDSNGVLDASKMKRFLAAEEIIPEAGYVAQFIVTIFSAIESKKPEMLLQLAGPLGPFFYGWYEAGANWSDMSDLERADALTGYIIDPIISVDLKKERRTKELKLYLAAKKKLKLSLEETWKRVTDDISHNGLLDDIERKSLLFTNKITRVALHK